MSTYNSEKYKALGVGDKIQRHHYWWNAIDMTAEPVADMEVGSILDSESDTYLEEINITELSNDLLAKVAGIETDIGRKALLIAVENIRLLDQKQKDYGSGNIAAFGEYGVLVRTWDKISRLRNLLTNVQTPKNESINDSWVDLGNYAIIAQILRKGQWK